MMEDCEVGIRVLTWERQRRSGNMALVFNSPGKYNPQLYRSHLPHPIKRQSDRTKGDRKT